MKNESNINKSEKKSTAINRQRPRIVENNYTKLLNKQGISANAYLCFAKKTT